MSNENFEKIYELVSKHFALRDDSLAYFKQEMNSPSIDPRFAGILDGAEDNRRSWEINESTLESIDGGWTNFKNTFESFVQETKIKYSEFRKNKVLIEKNEVKLQKAIINFYKKNREAYCNEMNFYYSVDDLGRITNRWKNEVVGENEFINDIEGKVRRQLEHIGEMKLPNRKLSLVFSLNYADWFMASTGETWTSCIGLNSDYASAYWAGLPGLVGDKNRALLYITDGTKKSYGGIEVDKFICRTWVLLDEDDELSYVRCYPLELLNSGGIYEITGFKMNPIGHGFTSKHPVTFLYYRNNCSCFIYQDETRFNVEQHIVGGCGGYSYVTSDGKNVHDDLFDYCEGLSGLIDGGVDICHYEYGEGYETCSSCDCSVHEDSTYYDNNDNTFCRDCYNDRYTCCPDCHEDTDNDSFITIRGSGREVCENCADNGAYGYCDSCNDYFDEDKMVDDDCDYLCHFCYAEVVKEREEEEKEATA